MVFTGDLIIVRLLFSAIFNYVISTCTPSFWLRKGFIKVNQPTDVESTGLFEFGEEVKF